MQYIHQILILFLALTFLIGCNPKENIYKLALSGNEDKIINFLSDATHDTLDKDILATYCFDYQIIEKSGYKGTSDIAKDILKIKAEEYSDLYSNTLLLIKNKKYNNANIKLLKYLDYLKWSGKEYQIGKLKSISNSIISNKKISHSDIYQLFLDIDVLAKIQYDRNQLLQSLATRYYFLSQLDQSDIKNDFIALKDECLKTTIIDISRENYNLDYNDVQQYHYNNLSTPFKDSFWGKMTRIYKDESLLTTEMNKALLDTTLILAENTGEIISSHFNLAFHYSSTNDPIQHYHYRKAIESISDNSCALTRFYLAIYGLINTPSTEQKIFYDRTIEYCKSCPSSTSNQVKFVLFNYLEPSLLYLSQKDQLDTLLSIKLLAETLYPGKSTLHLQDYYNMLLSRFFDVVQISNDVEKYSSIIINEALDLRLKEKYRKSLNSSPNEKELNYERINELLLKINSFKTVLPYEDSLYEELFLLYLNEEKNEELSYQKQTIDTAKLRSKLKKHNAILVNISQANDYYYSYTVSPKDFKIVKIESATADSLLVNWIQKIKSKEDTNRSKQLVKDQIIKSLGVDNTTNVIIIPDGQFSLVPLPSLFPNQHIEIYQDVLDFMNSDSKISIRQNEISLYSFSDSLTIGDRSVKMVPDLIYGFEECNSISSVFDQPISFNSGYDFLESNLFNETSVKLAHISSHASSNTTNHLDNFIIGRNNNGDVEKLYSYEIPSKKTIPQVVILSACETGTGKHNVGAGVQSLSRSLLDNGTQTVIKTLWKVNDQATTLLMTDLYQYWFDGHSLNTSLNLAKRHMQTNKVYSSPYYWAGFVLEGNPEVYIDRTEL